MSDDQTPTDPSPAKAKARKAAPRKRKPSTRKPTARTKPPAAPQADAPASSAPVADAVQRRLIEVPMPVRWRDLDAFNHVNNSKYLSYLEEARLHWMLGVPGQGLDEDVAPVVAAAHLNYRRPIEWPRQLRIELLVERLGNTSLTVAHRITDSEDASTLYCDGYVVLVWIDRQTGQAAPLPAGVRDACQG